MNWAIDYWKLLLFGILQFILVIPCLLMILLAESGRSGCAGKGGVFISVHRERKWPTKR